MTTNPTPDQLFNGSVHRFSNGYGRGLRVKTERNKMTLPPSIPKYRYPPEDDPNYFKSTKHEIVGDKAFKRLADQMIHQESGQWGSFLLKDQPTAPSVNYKKIRNRQVEEASQERNTARQHLAVGSQPRQQEQTKPQQSARSNSARDNIGTLFNNTTSNNLAICLGGSESARKEVYARSLNNLDPAFRKSLRTDLIASILPNRPVNEQRWAASRNVLSAGATQVWSSSLRY
jgi:hypothetical protein